jgi:hypothetical protein
MYTYHCTFPLFFIIIFYISQLFWLASQKLLSSNAVWHYKEYVNENQEMQPKKEINATLFTINILFLGGGGGEAASGKN